VKLTTIFGVDVAVGVEGFLFMLLKSLFIKTEVGAGTEVAVKLIIFMTLFVFGIEGAEVKLLLYHVLKKKISDEFIIAEVC
jgi:hypothetical protein